MFYKKIVFIFIFVLWILWFSFAQVDLSPVYTSDRFQPSNMFHAWCENEIDIVFDLEGWDINAINAILKYKKKDIKITKVLFKWDKENKLKYTVSDDAIILTKLKSNTWWVDHVVFQLFFKWKSDLKNTSFEFETWSYIVDISGNMIGLDDNYIFDFASVPECNPDIVPPIVELLFPIINTWEYLPLDSYFKFKIFDDGKGVNKGNINILLNNQKYNLSDIDCEWSGDVLTLYPDAWFSIGSDVKLEIIVDDKQVYGKSNFVDKKYKFKTSTWLSFLDNISPVEFRRIVDFYNNSKMIDTLSWSIGVLSSWSNKDLIDDNIVVATSTSFWFSVFAVLWWIVAWLLLLMRLFSLFVDKKD